MSVTEADSTVLQPLTNGGINAVPASKEEVHDASSASKENVDLNSNLKEVLTSERIGKATEIPAAEALNPSMPEPDSVFDAQSSSEAALSFADAPIPSQNNGVTQEHTINASSTMLESIGMNTEPTVSVVEEHATSSNEDIFSKPKEDVVEPESVANAPIEKGTEGEGSVEITKGLESADSRADAVALGAEDVSVGGAKSDSASVVTPAAVAADTAAIESQVGEVEPASVPSVTLAAEEPVAEPEAVAGLTEVPASSVESAVVADAIAPAIGVVTELVPAIDEQTVAEQEVTSEAADAIMVTETLHVESSVVKEVPVPASEPLQEDIPAGAIQAALFDEEPVSVAKPTAAEESFPQPEKVPAEASIIDELPASTPEVAAVDVIELSGSVTPVTSKPSPLVAPAEESAAVETKADVSEVADASSPAVLLIPATETTEAVPEVEELTTAQPEVAPESSVVEVPGPVLDSLSIESTTAEEIPVPATESSQGSTPAVEPALVEKALVEGSDVAEVSASFPEAVAEAEPQIVEQPPIESSTVEGVSVPVFAQETATETASLTESLAVEHQPTEFSVAGDVSAPEPEPISEPAPATAPVAAARQPPVESSIVEEVLAPTAEPIAEAAPAVEPEVMDLPHIRNSVVEELSAPTSEPLANAVSAIEAEAKNTSTEPSVVEEAPIPAPEPIAEAVAAAEPIIEKSPTESGIVEEVSALASEPLAGVATAAEPEVIKESHIGSRNAEERSAAVPKPPAEGMLVAEPLVVEQPSIASNIVEETPIAGSELIAEGLAAEPKAVDRQPIGSSTGEEAPLLTSVVVEAASDVGSVALAGPAEADEATAAPETAVITTPAPIDEGIVESIETAEPGAGAPFNNIPEAVEGVYSLETDIATLVELVPEDAPAAGNDVAIEVESETEPVDTGRKDALHGEATTLPAMDSVDVEESVKVQEVVSIAPEESSSEHASLTAHIEVSTTTEDVSAKEEEIAPEGVVADELSLLDAAVAPEEAATQTTSPPVNALSDTPAAVDYMEEVEPDAQTEFVEDGTETTLAKAPATVADGPEPEPVAAVPAARTDTSPETTSTEESQSSVAVDTSPAADEPAAPVAVLEDPLNAEEPVTALSEAAATTSLPEPTFVQELPIEDNEAMVSAEIPSVVEETTHAFEVPITATASIPEESGAPQEQKDASFDEPVLSVTAEEPTAAQGPAISREEEAPDVVEKPAPTNSDVVEEHHVIEESAPAFSVATEEPATPRDQVVPPVAADEPASTLMAAAEETTAQDILASEEQEAPLAVVEVPTPAGAEEATIQQQEEAAPNAAELVINADREAEETSVQEPSAPQSHQGEADVNPAPASTADEEESAVVAGPLALDEPNQPAQDSFALVAEGSMTPTLVAQDPAVSTSGMSEAQAIALEKAAAVIDEPTITPAITTEETAGPEELDTETTRAKPEIEEVGTKHEDSTILQAEETLVPNSVTDDLVPSTPADESILNGASSAGQSPLPTESPCEKIYTAADKSTTDEAAAMPPHAEIPVARNIEQATAAENSDEAVKVFDDVSSVNAQSAECNDNVEAAAAAPSTTSHSHLVSFAVTHIGAGGVQNHEGAQDDVSSKEQEAISPAGAIEEPTESGTTATEEVGTVTVDVDSLPVEVEVERPKSPWMPSFQVMTVGRGVETEEQQVPTFEETAMSIPQTGTTNGAIQEKLPEPVGGLPVVIIPVTAEAEEISDDVTGTVIAPPQLLVDTSPLEEPTEQSVEPSEQPRSWTRSYSVHSQGSPRQDNVDLDDTNTQEESPRSWTPSYSVHSQGSPLPIQVDLSDEATIPLDDAAENQAHELAELRDMEFATNEEILVTDVSPAKEISPQISGAPLGPREPDELSDQATNPDIAAESMPSDALVEVEDAAPAREVQVPQLVLDISEEATLPSTDDGEQSSTHLGTHSEQERPPSPSWVPSYSVSVQGSPSQERSNPLDEMPVESDEVLAAIVPVAVSPEPAPIRAAEYKSLATIISHQTVLPGAQTSAEAEDHHVLISNISPAVVETPSTGATEASSMTDDFTVAAISDASLATKGLPVPVDDGEKVENVLDTNNVPPALSSEEPEPPKSPWTTSYSVTTQGPNTASEAAEPDDLEPPPERAELADVPDDTSVPQDDAANDHKKDSVPSVVVDTADEIRDTPGEVFPTVEDTDEVPGQLKSDSLRLVTLDETRVTEAEDALVSPNAVSPVTARSRLESTASSRFFPGSWFSSSYKAVDEGRTSLEVAQGEFIATKATGSVNDAADTSSVEETSSDESDEDAEASESSTSEQKRRWCVIM